MHLRIGKILQMLELSFDAIHYTRKAAVSASTICQNRIVHRGAPPLAARELSYDLKTMRIDIPKEVATLFVPRHLMCEAPCCEEEHC